MAWNALREHGALKVEKEVGTRSAAQVTVTAILINILNPKCDEATITKRLVPLVFAGAVTGREPTLSTGGGTSDGRFIAPMGAQVVELGVVNAGIHKVNECVRIEDVDTLHAIYLQTLRNLLA